MYMSRIPQAKETFKYFVSETEIGNRITNIGLKAENLSRISAIVIIQEKVLDLTLFDFTISDLQVLRYALVIFLLQMDTRRMILLYGRGMRR